MASSINGDVIDVLQFDCTFRIYYHIILACAKCICDKCARVRINLEQDVVFIAPACDTIENTAYRIKFQTVNIGKSHQPFRTRTSAKSVTDSSKFSRLDIDGAQFAGIGTVQHSFVGVKCNGLNIRNPQRTDRGKTASVTANRNQCVGRIGYSITHVFL